MRKGTRHLTLVPSSAVNSPSSVTAASASSATPVAAAKPVSKEFSGVVGWDITAADMQEFLASAKGAPVRLNLYSPGGSVFEGLKIYSQLREYPGRVSIKMSSLVASAASYIAMAADELIAEDNTVFMFHNAWSLAIGDHRAIRKTADILDSLSGLIAQAYSARTGKPIASIREDMDEETWLYGEEIAEYGFADRVELAGDGPETEDEAQSKAQLAYRETLAKIKAAADSGEFTESWGPESLDLTAIAALIPAQDAGELAGDPGKIGGKMDQEQKPVASAKPTEPEPGYDDGVQAGIRAERERVAELKKWSDASPENRALAEIVNKAISEGKTASDVAPALMVAIANHKAGMGPSGENAPAVDTTGPTNVALSAEELALCAKMGVKPEDYIAHRKQEVA